MAQQIAKKVKDVNVAEAKEKERVLQLYSFKMVEEAENIKNNTEKGLALSSTLRVNCTFAVRTAVIVRVLFAALPWQFLQVLRETYYAIAAVIVTAIRCSDDCTVHSIRATVTAT